MKFVYIGWFVLMMVCFVGMMFDQIKRRKESDEVWKWLDNKKS